MIESFDCNDTEMLFFSRAVPRFKNIERVARRKLLMLSAASVLDSPSIRINDQWRICFRWQNENAFDVEIVDYH